NGGAVNWLGGIIDVYDTFGAYLFAGPIVNLPEGVWNIQCDQVLRSYNLGPNAYFKNLGTVKKTAKTEFTQVQVPFHNQGQTVVTEGILSFDNGVTMGRTFSASEGAAMYFYGGDFSYTATPVFNGPGIINMNGGSLTLAND